MNREAGIIYHDPSCNPRWLGYGVDEEHVIFAWINFNSGEEEEGRQGHKRYKGDEEYSKVFMEKT